MALAAAWFVGVAVAACGGAYGARFFVADASSEVEALASGLDKEKALTAALGSRIEMLEARLVLMAYAANQTRADLEAEVDALRGRLEDKVTNEDLRDEIRASSEGLVAEREAFAARANETLARVADMTASTAREAEVAAADSARRENLKASSRLNRTIEVAAQRLEVATELGETDVAARTAGGLRNLSTYQARLEEKLGSTATAAGAEIDANRRGAVDAVSAVAKTANATAHRAATVAREASAQAVLEVNKATVETEQNLAALNATAHDAIDTLKNYSADMLRVADRVEARLESSSELLGRLEDALSNVKDSVAKYETVTDSRFERQNFLFRAWIAGFFALAASILTVRHVYSHTTRMAFPEAQRKVLAILWMVPIYALTSWAAIVWPKAEDELQLASSVYEAYAVYMFFALLVAILGNGDGEDAAIAHGLPELVAQPFCTGVLSCSPGRLISGEHFMFRCKLATLQFVVFKPLLACAEYALLRFAQFRGALFDYTKPTLWITLLLNASVSLALAALFAFFHATQHSPRLKLHTPWPKFLAIKAVVFMTWFQAVAISLALRLKLGPKSFDDDLASAFQNFLVCIEMFVAAMAHAHIFGADEWQPDFKPLHVTASVADNLALQDFVRDFRSVLPSRRRKKPPRQALGDAKLPEDIQSDADDLSPTNEDSNEVFSALVDAPRLLTETDGLCCSVGENDVGAEDDDDDDDDDDNTGGGKKCHGDDDDDADPPPDKHHHDGADYVDDTLGYSTEMEMTAMGGGSTILHTGSRSCVDLV
ncbi:hypothetical protein CTAYLR_006076 [Chrysophaeum taylorii]|uniref:Uncharacterized protein n=1 Tax=Chrysophaeum taylorii TaxID=2483200 RepID=A0AAD7XLE6_9STRA|nr:hypothetical protein CTAYLR_006076 [Chrysophaeum taylorii]